MEKYAPPEAAAKEEEEVVASGSGTALGDIEHIEEIISKKKSDDEALTQLHNLCYGKFGQKTQRKKNLRLFNGFAEGTDTKSLVSSCSKTRPHVSTPRCNLAPFPLDLQAEKLADKKKVTMAHLKDVCEVLGLERGGSKEDVSTRIIEFLASPSDGGKAKAPRGAKRKSAGKGVPSS